MKNMAFLPERYRVLDGFGLKWIAVISMLIDHFGSIVMDGMLAPYKVDGTIFFTADMPFLVRNAMAIKDVCDILGSVAFPIFCFLVGEGFVHTHNRLKYGALVGAFALLSEIPFDLAHYQTWCCFTMQNVLFTLCIGIFTLYAIGLIEDKWTAVTASRVALTAAAVIAGGALAYLVRGEYVFLGVLAMSLFYLLRNSWWRFAAFAPLMVASPWALAAAVPLLLYNGKRGRGSKYFFYVFYPAHFLVFWGVAQLLAHR